MTLLVVGCEHDQVDEDFLNNRDSFIFFNRANGNYLVEEENTQPFNVVVGVSAPKDVARNVTVEINPESTAIEGVDFEFLGNFTTFNSGLIVQNLQVLANFEALTEEKVLILDIVDFDEVIDQRRSRFRLSMIRSCPLQAEFTGQYTITQTTPGYAPAAGAPIFSGTVTLEMGEGNEFERVFDVKFYAGLGLNNPPVPVSFELICNNVNMLGELEASGIGCGGSIAVAPTTGEPSIYDETDDSSFELTFFEDSNQICGNGQQTTILFTKVE